MEATVRPYFRELSDLYERVLGRPIDNSGYFNYAGFLERGEYTLGDVERELRNSAEYRARSS